MVRSMKKLILASGSPRRKELLGELGYQFEVVLSPAEEVHDHEMELVELCELNGALKGRAVLEMHPDAVVLAGDTLVYIDETPLGKPKSEQEAVEMLRRLSGKEHSVCSGMCLCEHGREVRFHEVTKVLFKELDDETIREYMRKVDVMDKAGAYAVQEHGEMIIEKLIGDYSNVVGMPQKLVDERLRAFGLKPGA